MNNPEEISEYISRIAIDEIEKVKERANSQDDYARLERRIVLSSIDELWMRHIDAMSKLRESVAFEWYAQKNPLIVYKEKAYFKFQDLINEIEYKVVKAIFSIWQTPKEVEVNQVDLSKKDLETNSNDNPLFDKNSNAKVNKIRV